MAEPIDFYFDFSSPYGYLASTEIDALAARHGRSVTWRPFVLGAAFKVTGQRALTEQPLRGDYARRDFARSARLLGVPLQDAGAISLLRLGRQPRLLLGRGAVAGQGPGEGGLSRGLRRGAGHNPGPGGRRDRPRARHRGARAGAGAAGDQGGAARRDRPGAGRAASSARPSSSSMASPSGATTGWASSTAGSRPADGRHGFSLAPVKSARDAGRQSRRSRRDRPCGETHRPMPVLTSEINPRSPGFRANAEAMGGLVEDLRKLVAKIAKGGGEKARRAISRAASCCRASASSLLLDPGAPFLELSQLAAHQVYRRGGAGRRDHHRHRPGSRAANASSSPMTPRSRAAPIIR